VLGYKFPGSGPPTNSLTYLGALTPSSPPVSGDAYGTDITMSADGSVIAVGAPSASPKNGTVVIFAGARAPGPPKPTLQHTELQTLSGAAAGDQFGSSVALSGSGAVLVACSSAATVASLANAGVCYVYVRNATAPFTYALAATLRSPTPRAGGFFGGQDGSVSVSATGLVVAIGEPAVAPSGTAYGSGTVFVFTAPDASWSSSTSVQLAPATPLSANFYGWMVSMSPDATVLAVGAAGDTVGAMTAAGSTTVWRRATTAAAWASTLVTASNAGANAGFGSGLSISTDGSTLAVGAYTANNTAGRAYTYTYSGTTSQWTEEVPILSPTFSSAGSNFGYNVRLAGDATSVFVSGHLSQVNSASPATGLDYAFSRGTGGACAGLLDRILAALGGPIGGAIGGAVALAIIAFIIHRCCCKKVEPPKAAVTSTPKALPNV
jgi:hypothetical protein